MNSTAQLKDNLVKARSYIVFILGLAIALSGVGWVEYSSGLALSPSAPAIRASKDRSPMRQPRVLSDNEHKWARVAWKYFENNVDVSSGLPGSVEKYPSGSLWDIGSYLIAVISAQRLALIDNSEFDRRISLALASIAKLPLFDKQLPNKAYNIKTLEMTDYANAPSARGLGWSAIDIGRFLVPLHVLIWNYPQHAVAARKAIAVWDFSNLTHNGELRGARVAKNGKTEYLQEGRLGYEQYAAKTFSLMGMDVTNSSNYLRQMARINVYGVSIAYDRRSPRQLDAQNYVISEPYILDGLEFGWDNTSSELAWRVYLAQQRRFERTGVLTAVTEDHIDQKPYFVYNTVFSDGKAWNTITDKGEDASKFRTLSVKAAFGWYALYDTGYSHKLIAGVSGLHEAERGWYGGVYEETGKPNKSISANTNAVVLESLAFIAKGPLIRFTESTKGP